MEFAIILQLQLPNYIIRHLKKLNLKMSTTIAWTCDVCQKTFDAYQKLVAHRLRIAHRSHDCYDQKYRHRRRKHSKQIIESLKEDYPVGGVIDDMNNSSVQELSDATQNNRTNLLLFHSCNCQIIL